MGPRTKKREEAPRVKQQPQELLEGKGRQDGTWRDRGETKGIRFTRHRGQRRGGDVFREAEEAGVPWRSHPATPSLSGRQRKLSAGHSGLKNLLPGLVTEDPSNHGLS